MELPFNLRKVKNIKQKPSRKINPARIYDKKGNKFVPSGRTLKTYDNYLPNNKNKSRKERPLVVIESNIDEELAVVPLSTKNGKNKTHLPKYQKGKSYFKHFVEIEDNEGKPIKIGDKFRENNPESDLSRKDVNKIIDKVFNHSLPSSSNREKIKIFRKRKKPRD